jgi:hypothetical protein
VGVCLAAAALIEQFWRHAADQSRRLAVATAVVLPLVMWPILAMRTVRRVSIADFSSTALADMASHARAIPDGSDIVVRDDRRPRANMASAFGTLVNEALLVSTGRHLNVWVDPPVANAEAASLRPPCAECVDLTLAVRNGRLVPTAAGR